MASLETLLTNSIGMLTEVMLEFQMWLKHPQLLDRALLLL